MGLPSHEAFLLGATAKAISTLVTYPLQLAQAKLRAGRAVRGVRRDYKGGYGCLIVVALVDRLLSPRFRVSPRVTHGASTTEDGDLLARK